jgi:fructose-bisphosphate aldolase, class I
VPLVGCEGETLTQGLDNLDACVGQYAASGASFAKWRAALRIGKGGGPSEKAVEGNAVQLATYARICQVDAAAMQLQCCKERFNGRVCI